MKVVFTKEESQRVPDELRNLFPIGSTVYTITRNISRSGMQREISVISITMDYSRCKVCRNSAVDHGHYDAHDGRTHKFEANVKPLILHPNWSVAGLTGISLNRGGMHDGLVVKGCGFSHSQYIADMISLKLYGVEGKLNYQEM